jgi:hypothetical protein
MRSCADLWILFRAAAGARRGLDHVVRCRSLARVFGVHPLVSLRGSAAAEVTALALGCEVVRGGPSRVLRGLNPDVLVIDEPVAANAQRWIAAGRRAGCLVVSVHEPGLGRLGADVVIHGAASAFARRNNAGRRLAWLDPSLVVENTSCASWSVLVGLGRGPRAELALDIAQAIVDANPCSTVSLAGGFVGTLPRLRERFPLIESARSPRQQMSRPGPADAGIAVSLDEACVPCLAPWQPSVPSSLLNTRRLPPSSGAAHASQAIRSLPGMPQRNVYRFWATRRYAVIRPRGRTVDLALVARPTAHGSSRRFSWRGTLDACCDFRSR